MSYMPQDQDTYLQEKDVDEPEKQAKEKEDEDMEFTVRSYCETQYNSVVRASTLASFLSLQSNAHTHTYTHIQAHLLCSVKFLPPIWPLKYASGFILLLFLKSVVPLLRDPYRPCRVSDFPTLHPFFRPRCQSKDTWLWSCSVSPSASVLVSSLFVFFQRGSHLKYGTVLPVFLSFTHLRHHCAC